METISLCMITRDEEDFLPRCLESVKSLVDEIIIVDTGSTDGTIAVAKRYGAKVYQHPWEEDYSKHRNQSLAYATGDWILVMDADEVIAEKDLARIRTILDTVRADGFYFTLRNYEGTSNLANLTVNPGDYEEGKGFPGYIGCDLVRLFRNDSQIYFVGQVHETVTPAVLESRKITYNTGIPIHHYGKVRWDRMKRKQDAYLALGRKRLEDNPFDPAAYKGLCDQLLDAGMPEGALAIADRGLIVFPDMPELHFDRGLSLDRLGMRGDAAQEYRWVLARHPDHLGACHNIGQIFFGKNEFKKTVEVLNRGIKAGIRHPAVFFLLGRALTAAGDSGKALDSFKLVLELQPNFPEVNCHIAVLFLNNHQHNEALEALEKEIEIGGNLVAAYNLLGEMSLYWKDRDSARDFFMKVLTIEPDNATARSHLEHIGCRGPSPLH